MYVSIESHSKNMYYIKSSVSVSERERERMDHSTISWKLILFIDKSNINHQEIKL